MKKFPDRNDLDTRLSKNGGHSSGKADTDYTNFFFVVNTVGAEAGVKLEECTDPFLQPFIAPIFSPDTVRSELQTIESEFKLLLRDDSQRIYQVISSRSNPDHPASWNFSCGNHKSLGDAEELIPKLIEHYNKHYCASSMRCVILSPLPIGEMQNRFQTTLASIPNRGAGRKDWGTIPYFLEKDRCTETFVEPVIDANFLLMHFYFPGREDDGYSASGGYAADLLRQKDHGGLFDVLKRKQLILDLYVETAYEHAGNRRLSVIARLTRTGLNKYQDVVQEVFHMLARAKAVSPQKGLVEEQDRLRQIRFCASQMSDFTLAETVAYNMRHSHLQPENLLYGSNEIRIGSGFNNDDIIRNLGFLRPENMILAILSPKCKSIATEEEKWFGTKWGTRKIPDDDMKRYITAADLHLDQLPSEPRLPPPNPFITRRDFQSEILEPPLGLKTRGTAEEEGKEKRRPPPTALQTGQNDIWFAPGEGKWKEPRIKIDMCIRPNNVFTDAESAEKTDIFMESIRHGHATLFHLLEESGMRFSADQIRDSLVISATLFKDMFSVLPTKLLSALRDHQPAEADFDAIKEDFLQRYQRDRLENPSSHSRRHLNLLISEYDYSPEQAIAALRTITFDDMREWGTKIFNTAQFQFLICGDVTESAAAEWWSTCQKELKLDWRPYEDLSRPRARRPRSGRISLFKRVMVDPENANSHVKGVMFFAASRQAKHIAAPMLLVQVLRQRASEELRNEHGFYAAGVQLETGPQQSAISIHVECSDCSCIEATEFMLKFIKEAARTVELLSPEELEEHRAACINSSDKKIQTLDEYHSWAWQSISARTYAFHKRMYP